MKKFTKILALCMLVIMVSLTFASCGLFGPKISKLKENLKDDDYYAYTGDGEDIEYYVASVLGTKLSKTPDRYLRAEHEDNNDEFLYALSYKKTSDAKKTYDDLEDWAEDFGKASDEDITWGRIGKVVYIGTVDAVKTAFGFPYSLFIKAKN